MSRLRIYAEADAATPLLDTEEPDEIAEALAPIGVGFERWPTRDVADPSTILDVYAPEIARLKGRGGFQSVDTVSLTPDHPDRAALRQKFLSEHTHAEAEVRFFIDGAALFTLHAGDRVFAMLCTKGDLLAVPAGMPHWFDMGAEPRFTAIRLFINPDGWVASFTGDAIADRFPRHA
jgi:1,2-dihydroxy-3-keto-5-methylthiopentene dioxygenase